MGNKSCEVFALEIEYNGIDKADILYLSCYCPHCRTPIFSEMFYKPDVKTKIVECFECKKKFKAVWTKDTPMDDKRR